MTSATGMPGTVCWMCLLCQATLSWRTLSWNPAAVNVVEQGRQEQEGKTRRINPTEITLVTPAETVKVANVATRVIMAAATTAELATVCDCTGSVCACGWVVCNGPWPWCWWSGHDPLPPTPPPPSATTRPHAPSTMTHSLLPPTPPLSDLSPSPETQLQSVKMFCFHIQAKGKVTPVETVKNRRWFLTVLHIRVVC